MRNKRPQQPPAGGQYQQQRRRGDADRAQDMRGIGGAAAAALNADTRARSSGKLRS